MPSDLLTFRPNSGDSSPKKNVFLIGPGGVGKTTMGPLLAARLDATFVDLDQCFCEQVAPIRIFLDQHGYAAYLRTNAALFRTLLSEAERTPRTVYALSSGFLVTDTEAELVAQNRALVRQEGTAVLLLPSKDLAECVAIIVERQLQRGFRLERNAQTALALQRVPLYSALGDLTVYGAGAPAQVAEAASLQLRALWRS